MRVLRYTGRMAVLPIVTGADTPVLRAKTAVIPNVTKNVLKLAKDMEDTVKAADGLGIAAPQVGQSLRICIAKLGGKFVTLVNPQITWKSAETSVAEEGCLSLPGLWRDVTRPVGIVVTFTDLKGKGQERKLEGIDARVVQHEVDHLEGVLIVDNAAMRP